VRRHRLLTGSVFGGVLPALFAVAAMAEGPGRYSVAGSNAKDNESYQGTATITKTGNSTWQVVETIGNDMLEGFGIGDGKVIAVYYATDGGSQLALYTANADGSYTGIWADEDDKEVSTETLKPQ
jgi:hypothetical protein